MTRLKLFAVATVVAATIGVGGLATAPAASAATNLTCNQAAAISLHYSALSAHAYSDGSSFWGGFYAVLASLYGGYC